MKALILCRGVKPMSKMMIELNEELEERLQEAAIQEQRPKEELLLDAIRQYLHSKKDSPANFGDAYEPLRKMVGLVPNGLSDTSVYHDIRPNETE
jgi:hypothetical protein